MYNFSLYTGLYTIGSYIDGAQCAYIHGPGHRDILWPLSPPPLFLNKKFIFIVPTPSIISLLKTFESLKDTSVLRTYTCIFRLKVMVVSRKFIL
jgi:hypothetical protein